MFNQLILFVICLITAVSTYAQATFKGGSQALDRFVQEHIVYPEFSRRNCLDGVVQVRFRVNSDGTVSEVAVHRGPELDLDDEARRVVRMTSGKWALPNGTVSAVMVLPVRFAPDYTRCNTTGRMNREDAIEAYRNQQELQNVVTNYYENKYQGKADPAKESYINSLKEQLGFDDELISDVLKQAQAKLKQGDREGACEDWKFIRNIGSKRADDQMAKYCN